MMLPLVSLVLGLGAGTAQAQSPYMWGVGPTLGTIAYPGQYPNRFPKLGEADAARLPDADTDDKRRITGVDEVGGDAMVGARGVIYFNRDWRGGIRTHLFSLGQNYNNLDITFEADKIIFSERKFGAYAGAGLGFGKMKFGAEESDAELSLNTYLLRGHVGGVYRLKKAAIEAGLFVQPVFPGLQTYTASDGKEAQIEGLLSVGADGGGGGYWNGGLELTVYFGDFVPPKNKKKKKKKGRR